MSEYRFMNQLIEKEHIPTPAYVFDLDKMKEFAEKVKRCLTGKAEICYAMKANPFLIKPMMEIVSSLEVCSPGEFRICERAGIPMEKIVLSGVYKNPDDICYKAKLQYLILKILIEIRTYHTKSISVPKYDIKFFKEVKDAILYIQSNYDKKITLEELSKETYIDKYTLSKKFKEFTGITIVNYINNYRCKMALSVIQNGEQINNAARLCGFNNISFFTKTFKKYTGNLPSFYKKKPSL